MTPAPDKSHRLQQAAPPRPPDRPLARWLDAANLERALAAVAALFFCASLVHPGFPSSHEHANYLPRLYGFCQALRDGQWDARWLGGFAHGYGYPFFNFYPPGFYWLAAPWHFLGLSYVNALRIALILSNLLGSWGAWRLGRRMWASRAAAFWTAVVFTFFPYRAADLSVRGALSELCALNLIPWALWFFLGLARQPRKRRFIGAALMFAAIVWTHNAAALCLAGFLPVFLTAVMWAEGQLGRRGAAAAAGAYALAIGLSAAFWIPALHERQFTHLERAFQGFYDARNQLLEPDRLFDNGWRYGASTAAYGQRMSFGLRWTTWGVLAVALAAVFRRKPLPISHRRKLIALLGFFFLLIFLIIQPSRPLWSALGPARLIQFPWRLLALAAPIVGLLAGGAAGVFFQRKPASIRRLAGAALAAGVLALSWPTLKPESWFQIEDASVERTVKTAYLTTTGRNEYLPRWAQWGMDADFLRFQRGGKLLAVGGPGQSTAEGDILVKKGHHHVFSIRLKADAEMGFEHYYFPGWRLRLNGRPAPIRRSLDGLMLFDLPAGDWTVDLRFDDSPARAWGEWISWICLIVVAGLALADIARRRRDAAHRKRMAVSERAGAGT